MKGKYVILLCFLVNFTACEEVIELDLNETEPLLVIEAEVRNIIDGSYVRLSQSKNFYDHTDFLTIDEAIVTIVELDGATYNLTEVQPGYYKNPDLIGIAGKTYLLTVETNGQKYTATSTMPSVVPIDSLRIDFNESNAFSDEGYQVYCHFSDPASEQNFYKWRIYENQESVDGIFAWDDELFNGSSNASYPFFRERFESGDTITVEMFGVDAANYEYLLGLEAIYNSGGPGGGSAAPGNPTTNLSGDALGYFGAFVYDVETRVIAD